MRGCGIYRNTHEGFPNKNTIAGHVLYEIFNHDHKTNALITTETEVEIEAPRAFGEIELRVIY